jgi:hypothetical protein
MPSLQKKSLEFSQHFDKSKFQLTLFKFYFPDDKKLVVCESQILGHISKLESHSRRFVAVEDKTLLLERMGNASKDGNSGVI